MADVQGVSVPDTGLNYVLKVKHIFLTFLQEFCSFQKPENLLYWVPKEPEKSNVWIVDSYAHDLETMTEKKPVITFRRGPLYVAQNTLYDNMLRIEAREDNRHPGFINNDVEYKTFLFSGQIDWQCISRQGIEAENMASTVAMLHQVHKQVLRQKGLHEIKTIQIGEENLITGDVETEMIMVPVTVSFDMQAHYEIWKDANPHRHTFIKGSVNGDMLMNTDL